VNPGAVLPRLMSFSAEMLWERGNITRGRPEDQPSHPIKQLEAIKAFDELHLHGRGILRGAPFVRILMEDPILLLLTLWARVQLCMSGFTCPLNYPEMSPWVGELIRNYAGIVRIGGPRARLLSQRFQSSQRPSQHPILTSRSPGI